MTKKPATGQGARRRGEPRRIRLPGLITEEPIGFGEVIKRATSAVGARPCGGCARRARRLDSRIIFTGTKR
jgi:hypothetical protein